MGKICEIPGWAEITQPELLVEIGKGYRGGEWQQVGGKWYERADGDKSLQKIVDMWLEEVMAVWMLSAYMVEGRRVGYTRTADEVEATLREWDLIDENGLVEWERK